METVHQTIKGLCVRTTTYMHSAQMLIKEQDYNSAVSRIYYAMFYRVQAILLTQNVAASTHTGTAQKFGELFIKTGIFPKEFSRHLGYAMERRSKGDYEVFSPIDAETAIDLFQTASLFNQELLGYLIANGFEE